jgi:hypothetical protein
MFDPRSDMLMFLYHMLRYAMKAKVAESREMKEIVIPKMTYHTFGSIQTVEIALLSADLSNHGRENCTE